MKRRVGASRIARLRVLDLPGRGATAVQDYVGPPGAPTLVLLHGVALTAELNWSRVMDALGGHYRVIAFDQRGHGGGSPGSSPFRLEDCADDVAAAMDELGVDECIPVGYSMGGCIAQLMWRRHPERTAGMVLCASARNVLGSPLERYVASLMPFTVATARLARMMVPLGGDLVGAVLLDGDADPQARRWARHEMGRTSLVTVLSAMHAVCGFSSHEWIGSVDVPTAVVITRNDRIVPPARQWKLADAIPGCMAYEVDGGHGVFLDSPGSLGAVLLRACEAVTVGAQSDLVGYEATGPQVSAC